MVDRDPILFREWNAYMKHRQIMVSSIVLKSFGWADWNTSHAKLLGVLLWEYEGSKANEFRYNKLLRRHGYRRTHNYKLLNDLLKSSVLRRSGRGTYFLDAKSLEVAERAIAFMKQADHICHESPERQDCSIQ
jgi:hypothetical protein